MMSMLNNAMLAVSSSLAASILAKVTVTTALALAGTWLLRRRCAAVRHLLLAAAFATLLVLPIASIVAPAVSVAVPIAAQQAPALSAFGTITDAVSPTVPAGAVDGPTPSMSESSGLPTVGLLLAVWLAGATLSLAPVVVGLWQMRSLRRSGLPWRHGRSVVESLALEADIHRGVDVLLHESLPGPMTCGVLRPAIVLPMDARTWAEEDLRRAIVHELAHVRRRDWVSQCVARAACACYWFHPLVWIAWRQFVLDAERACDDEVLRRTEATAYAAQLVLLAQRLSATRAPLLAMANRHDLAARVGALLDNRQPRGRAGVFAVAVSWTASAVLVATVSPLRIVASASAPDGATADTPKFEVVSIKPCKPVDVPLEGRGGGAAAVRSSPGRLHLDCVPVGGNGLIRQAYGAFASGRYNAFLQSAAVRVEGGPDWIRSDRFTIDAKAEGTPSVEMMRGPMLQALLEDRFQLRLHRDIRPIPVYELTVAKGGPRLRPFNGRCKPVDFTKGDIPGQLEAEGACGIAMHDAVIEAPGQTLDDFIRFVLTLLDRPVVDKTGLTGRFDIHLDIPSDDRPAPDITATLAAAVQRQLGLKLVPARGPGEFLVIDRVERPSANSASAAFEAPSRAGAGR